MKDQACESVERKALDEILDRIVSCKASVYSRAMLIREINDRLNGADPQTGTEDKKSADASCIFDSFNRCLSEFEDAVRSLELETNRLNKLV